ncbi:MAG: hypothetical protein U0704_04725 [Candidatus Eisenbacteria bacterium]
MRTRLIAFLLFVSLVPVAPAAHADGIRAKIEGPAADGRTYTVRMVGSAPGDTFEPWGAAEGLVNDVPVTKLIRFRPTGEPGVFTFTRNWPSEGRWLVRMSPGHPPAPATVVRLDREGRVRRHRHYAHSDGIRESRRELRPREAKEEADC